MKPLTCLAIGGLAFVATGCLIGDVDVDDDGLFAGEAGTCRAHRSGGYEDDVQTWEGDGLLRQWIREGNRHTYYYDVGLLVEDDDPMYIEGPRKVTYEYRGDRLTAMREVVDGEQRDSFDQSTTDTEAGTHLERTQRVVGGGGGVTVTTATFDFDREGRLLSGVVVGSDPPSDMLTITRDGARVTEVRWWRTLRDGTVEGERRNRYVYDGGNRLIEIQGDETLPFRTSIQHDGGRVTQQDVFPNDPARNRTSELTFSTYGHLDGWKVDLGADGTFEETTTYDECYHELKSKLDSRVDLTTGEWLSQLRDYTRPRALLPL